MTKRNFTAILACLCVALGFLFSNTVQAAPVYDHFNVQLSTLTDNTHTFTYTITPVGSSSIRSGLSSNSVGTSTTPSQIVVAGNSDLISATLTIKDVVKNVPKIIYSATINYSKSGGIISSTITNMNLSQTYFSSKNIQPTDTSEPSVQITLSSAS